MNKAVILGANYYIGLSIIRCLGIKGVYTVAIDYDEKNAYAFKSKYLNEKLIAPHYKNESKKFLKFLITYAKKQEEKPVLFPSADPYVEFIDEHFEELKKYYLFPQTEKGLYTKAMDKEALSKLAIKHKVLIPETISPNEKDFMKKLKKEIGFPCLVKPTDSPSFVSIFRKKLFVVNNETELNEKLKIVKEANQNVIIQRMIPGFDDHMYTFDAYLNQNSKVTHYMTAQKQRQYPINYGASVYTKQKYVKELIEIGTKFLEGIKWKGFAEIEFKKDAKTGKFYLIEINVRTTNFNNLIYKCGLNMPYICYLEMTNQDIGNYYLTEDKNICFWYSYEDYFAIKEYIRTKQLTRRQVLKSLFNKKAHSIWSLTDPQPYFMFFNLKILKKIKHRKLKI